MRRTLILSVIGSAVPCIPLSKKYGEEENVNVVACEVRTMLTARNKQPLSRQHTRYTDPEKHTFTGFHLWGIMM